MEAERRVGLTVSRVAGNARHALMELRHEGLPAVQALERRENTAMWRVQCKGLWTKRAGSVESCSISAEAAVGATLEPGRMQMPTMRKRECLIPHGWTVYEQLLCLDTKSVRTQTWGCANSLSLEAAAAVTPTCPPAIVHLLADGASLG